MEHGNIYSETVFFPKVLFCFLSSTGDWTQDLAFACRVLYHINQVANPSTELLVSEMGSCFIPGWPWTVILLFELTGIAGMTDSWHCAQPLVEMGWLWTLILQISASKVPGIIGLSHCAQHTKDFELVTNRLYGKKKKKKKNQKKTQPRNTTDLFHFQYHYCSAKKCYI
jgi:hypothetical protein